MAKVDVNCDRIEAAAFAIDRYIVMHRQYMQAMNAEMLRLRLQWNGEDHQQAFLQWKTLSSSRGLLMELEEWATTLHWVAKRYAEVQNTAINRAKRL